jgi:hypothetical protein
MSRKMILCFALVLSGTLFGCSTAAHRSSTTSSKQPDIPYLSNYGIPYETKPVFLSSGGIFYWFISADLKRINYEPCCGYYGVDPIQQSKSVLVFKIVKSYGVPLDLRNGNRVASSDVVGKKYRAKLKGDHIVSVSEIQ